MESETLTVAVTEFICRLVIFVGGLVLKVIAALLPKYQLLNSPWESPKNGKNKIRQKINLILTIKGEFTCKDRKTGGMVAHGINKNAESST